jgi:hypothetical protein
MKFSTGGWRQATPPANGNDYVSASGGSSGGGGLVHIVTKPYAAGLNHGLEVVFNELSSTYDTYRIVGQWVQPTYDQHGSLRLRLLSAGNVEDADPFYNHYREHHDLQNDGLAALGIHTIDDPIATYAEIGRSGGDTQFTMDISNVLAPRPATYHTSCVSVAVNTVGQYAAERNFTTMMDCKGSYSVARAHTGLVIYALDDDQCTGSFSLYGYAKA